MGLRLAAALFAIAACGPSRGTIGAVLTQDSQARVFVREVPPGLAADRAGVRVGDEVLLIDGRDARQMTAQAVHVALSGDVGETVKLTLVRDGRIERVLLARTPPPAPPPKASQAPPEPP
jgi:C-terminal processing protease CtpA/Prc